MEIAVVESDLHVASALKDLLCPRHQVNCFVSNSALMNELTKSNYDFYIMEWTTQYIHSLEVLRFIREKLFSPDPVMFLAANFHEGELIQALDAGADDYLDKSIKSDILLAKLEAISRRANALTVYGAGKELHGYYFDPAERIVCYSNEQIVLSVKQFELAYYFFNNCQRPLSRKQLLLAVWGKNQTEVSTLFSRTLDVHVRYLRQKLRLDNRASHVKLVAIHGYGYKLIRVFRPV